MNTPFTSYGFHATGAPQSRTMPARLNDIINVKDWGAKGDGNTNDTAAINAAIDYVYTLPRKTAFIFFPPGIYMITGQFLLDRDPNAHGGSASLCFMGSGRDV